VLPLSLGPNACCSMAKASRRRAFGNVYLAKDRKTWRSVCSEFPKKFDDVNFQRELDALLHLRDNGSHPHVAAEKGMMRTA
jgi:hypothetical protein